MKNYKLSMTTDILAPRIKHLTSENRALKNKVKQLEAELRTTNQVFNELVIEYENRKSNYPDDAYLNNPESLPDK